MTKVKQSDKLGVMKKCWHVALDSEGSVMQRVITGDTIKEAIGKIEENLVEMIFSVEYIGVLDED